MGNMLNIKKGGPADLPIRVVLYGPHGVGKTGFGADAPAPIFLPCEDGLDAYPHAVAFPKPSGWDDVLEAISILSRGDPKLADRKTLVIDTLDALDAIVTMKVRQDARYANGTVPALEEIGGGYGKGAKRVLELWQDLTARLEALQAKRGLHLVLLAHATSEKVKLPTGEDVARHSLKLTGQSSAHVKEWTRDLLFATFEVRRQGKFVRQSLSVGKRLLYTTQADSGAYDAKNRVGLPQTLPLSWAAYADARAHGLRALAGGGDAVDDDLVAEVQAAMLALPERMRTKQVTNEPLLDLAKAQGNGALRKLLNWSITKADEIAADMASRAARERAREETAATEAPATKAPEVEQEKPTEKAAVTPAGEPETPTAAEELGLEDGEATFEQGDAYEGEDPPEDPADMADGLQAAAAKADPTPAPPATPPASEPAPSTPSSGSDKPASGSASGKPRGGSTSVVRKPAKTKPK